MNSLACGLDIALWMHLTLSSLLHNVITIIFIFNLLKTFFLNFTKSIQYIMCKKKWLTCIVLPVAHRHKCWISLYLLLYDNYYYIIVSLWIYTCTGSLTSDILHITVIKSVCHSSFLFIYWLIFCFIFFYCFQIIQLSCISVLLDRSEAIHTSVNKWKVSNQKAKLRAL